MRRLNQHDDRGVAAIFVVLMVPVLVLCASIRVRWRSWHRGRRQTQNAADAGALAKATDCVQGRHDDRLHCLPDQWCCRSPTRADLR